MSSDSTEPAELFECRKCGDCCKGYGGNYLREEDVDAISHFIGSDPGRFVTQYCSLSGTRPVLAQRSDGYCIFWDKVCTIHPVKPQMCRKWPFIESLLVDGNNWLIMAGSCPGINADVSVIKVQKYVKRVLAGDRC